MHRHRAMILVSALATPLLLAAAAQAPSAPAPSRSSAPTAAKSAPAAAAASAWIPVAAKDWRSRAPKLIGKPVELSGTLMTLIAIDPHSDFSNTAWVRNERNEELGMVLFDQVGPEQISWMLKNGCHQGCEAVFMRGVVLSDEKYPEPVLRIKDISFESLAGAAPISMVVVEPNAGKTAAGSGKPLLPPAEIPTEHGATGSVLIPESAPSGSSGKSIWEQMKDRSNTMRQRDRNMDQSLIPGPERPGNFETYYRSVRDTPLVNLFAKSPWNGGRNSWPRVALVVEANPKHGDSLLYKRPGDKVDDACWQLRAKIWTGPAASQDIATFNACLSEMRFNVAYSDVALWGMTPKTSMLEHNTGADRTIGPKPPAIPVPKLQFSDGSNIDTVMLGTLLLDMGFDCGVPDGRVWVLDGVKP